MAYIYLGVKKNISASKFCKPFKGFFSKLGVGEGFSLGSTHVCEMFSACPFRDMSGTRGDLPKG